VVEAQSGGYRRPFVRQFRGKGEAAGARDGLRRRPTSARCGDPHGRGRRFASVSNPSVHTSVSWMDSVVCSNFHGFMPAPNLIQSFRISAARSVADYAGAGSVLVDTAGIVGTPIPCILSIVHKQQNRSK
jgi:hypothetical protein